jgi:protein SCO1
VFARASSQGCASPVLDHSVTAGWVFIEESSLVMNKPTRSIEWTVWGGLVLVMVAVVGAFIFSKSGLAGSGFPVYGIVPDFSLTNQFGRVIALSDLRGKVWVADVIFTRCPGPCLKMTRLMSELQAALPADEPVRLISLTADPEFDTAEVLNRYAGRFRASPNHWHFLTGKKPDLYRLATKGLLLALEEVNPEQRESENDLFVHSTLVVVVDRQGRIRASFEGAEPSSREKILNAIHALLKEKQP